MDARQDIEVKRNLLFFLIANDHFFLKILKSRLEKNEVELARWKQTNDDVTEIYPEKSLKRSIYYFHLVNTTNSF